MRLDLAFPGVPWYKKIKEKRTREKFDASMDSGLSDPRILLDMRRRTGLAPGVGGGECFSGLYETHTDARFFPGGSSREYSPNQKLPGESRSPALLGHVVTELPEGGSFSGKNIR